MASVDEKKKMLKELFRMLHSGVSPDEIKTRFKHLLENTSPVEIAKIEEELVKEGTSREEIQRLCDVHLAVFREQLETQRLDAAPDSPVGILLEEHKAILGLLGKLSEIAGKIGQTGSLNQARGELARLKQVSEELLDAENHYLREENALFPVLERHGIAEPPAIMWMEHNQLRELKKKLRRLSEDYGSMDFVVFKQQLAETSQALNNTLSSHIFKENNILLPTALRVVNTEEWRIMRADFDEIGYCCFTPKQAAGSVAFEGSKGGEVKPMVKEDEIRMETGSLSHAEVEALLNTLPVDVTFVAKDDTVKYFSKSQGRIFVRAKSVIGRKVQLCHPQKSVHIVNKIVEAFKAGRKDVAEFWIQMGGRLVHIRYFAVRDGKGEYLGTLEVTQDITDIKKIEGEHRLLDWEE